jgi:calmodulin
MLLIIKMNSYSLNIKSYIKQELIDVSLALFKKFDKTNSGFIQPKDLGTMLRLLGFNPTEKDLRDMVDKLEDDPMNPKGITREGFLTCVARKERDTDSIDELTQSFKIFDPEGKGLIEEKRLRFVLCKTGDGLTDEEMDNLMKEAIPFTQVLNDIKFIKYTEFALFLKDLYQPPPAEDPKKKGKGGKK